MLKRVHLNISEIKLICFDKTYTGKSFYICSFLCSQVSPLLPLETVHQLGVPTRSQIFFICSPNKVLRKISRMHKLNVNSYSLFCIKILPFDDTLTLG